MKALRCMIVGDGSIFEVDMDGRMVGRQLKGIIMDKLPEVVDCDADELTLYVAKRDDHWLTMHDRDIKSLEEGTIPPRIQQMMTKENEIGRTDRVGSATYGFPQDGDAFGDKIHVLVLRPSTEGAGISKGRADFRSSHMRESFDREPHVASNASYDASGPVFKIGSHNASGNEGGSLFTNSSPINELREAHVDSSANYDASGPVFKASDYSSIQDANMGENFDASGSVHKASQAS